MLGSGSAGNSALVATEHCKILVDGGLSARQVVLRLEQCGIRRSSSTALSSRTNTPITSAALKFSATNSICQFTAIDSRPRRFGPAISRSDVGTGDCLRLALSFRSAISRSNVSRAARRRGPARVRVSGRLGSLGFITDLGYVTKLITERLRAVQTLVVETNHDEKLLQNDTHRPWPVKQRIQSRHGHLSNTAAAGVIEELLAGKIERVVLGHLSRDWNTPALALSTVRASLRSATGTTSKLIAPCNSKSVPYFGSATPSSARFNQLSKTISSKTGSSGSPPSHTVATKTDDCRWHFTVRSDTLAATPCFV